MLLHLIPKNNSYLEANAPLRYIHFTQNFAYATDGSMAVKIPTTRLFPEGLPEGCSFFIHWSVWLENKLHQADWLDFDGERVIASKFAKKGHANAAAIVNTLTADDLGGTFPNVEYVFESCAEPTDTCRLGFSASLMDILLKVFKDAAVRVEIYGTKIMLIFVAEGEEIGRAILMQMVNDNWQNHGGTKKSAEVLKERGSNE